MIGAGIDLLQVACRTALFGAGSLFANGEVGVVYDPSDLRSMYQDSSATTPVTAVEQPVGYIADRSGNGYHAVQATPSLRPTLSARKNLLTYSQLLDNPVWSDPAAVTMTEAAGVAPDGTTTATRYQCAVTGASSVHDQVVTPNMPSQQVTFSIWAKSNDGATHLVQLKNTHAGVIDNFSSNFSVGDTWQRLTFTVTNGAGGTGQIVGIRMASTNGDLLLWGAQLEHGAAATEYQSIGAATDYNSDPSLFPWYLRFNGVSTRLDIPAMALASSSLSMFVALKNRSLTGYRVIVENDAYAGLADATFSSGMISTTGYYGSANNTSVILNSGAVITENAPTVLTGLSTVPNLVTIRTDGVQRSTSAASQGSAGVYGTYTAKIGDRAAGGAALNMDFYGLILRNALPTSAELAAIEEYMAAKMRTTL